MSTVIPGFLDIQRTIYGLYAVVAPIIGAIVGVVIGKFSEMRPQIVEIWGSIKGIITGAMAIVQAVVAIATKLIGILWAKNGAGILRAVGGTFGGIVKIIGGAMKIVLGVVNLVLGLLTGDWAKAGKALKTIVSGIKDVLIGVWRVIKNTIGALVLTLLRELQAKFVRFLVWSETGLRTRLAKIRDYVLSPLRAAGTALAGILRSLRDRFTTGVDAIGKAWDGLKEKAKAPIRFVVTRSLTTG